MAGVRDSQEALVLRTSNPVLNENIFAPQTSYERFAESGRTVMTLNGAVTTTAVLMGICAATGIAVWTYAATNPAIVYPAALGGVLLSFVLVLICTFKPAASPYLALPIAVAQGAFAGGASVLWSTYAAGASGVVGTLGAGLVLQSVLLTLCVSGTLLFLYATRIIKATENFKLGVVAATGGLCVFMLISLVLNLVGIQIPYIWGNGIIGIGFAGLVVVIAALNLVLDFDFIEQGAANRLPKHMEWLAAIGLLVTLVWLYVSILRLLAKLQSRD